ncbi:3990_t:CDS:2 [Entrophospora sp. SA101]|nr:3990_t:CDS:2 [Entrophospora sp. SA101]CAJ0843012.1 12949_t:CDS:2 [Entrophospora sp. SA101]
MLRTLPSTTVAELLKNEEEIVGLAESSLDHLINIFHKYLRSDHNMIKPINSEAVIEENSGSDFNNFGKDFNKDSSSQISQQTSNQNINAEDSPVEKELDLSGILIFVNKIVKIITLGP